MEKQTLTPEEIEIKEAQMSAFYDQKLPFLRKWHEHEVMIAEIEEAKVRTIVARSQLAKIEAAKTQEKPIGDSGKEAS